MLHVLQVQSRKMGDARASMKSMASKFSFQILPAFIAVVFFSFHLPNDIWTCSAAKMLSIQNIMASEANSIMSISHCRRSIAGFSRVGVWDED